MSTAPDSLNPRQFDQKRRRSVRDHPGYHNSPGPHYGVTGGYAGFSLLGGYPLAPISANEPDGSTAEDSPQASWGVGSG